MEKEIRMPFNEYQYLVKTLEEHQDFVKNVKSKDGLIIIDIRGCSHYRHTYLPKILTEGDLKKEWDTFHAEFKAMEESVEEAWNRHRDIERKLNRYRNRNLFERIFNIKPRV